MVSLVLPGDAVNQYQQLTLNDEDLGFYQILSDGLDEMK